MTWTPPADSLRIETIDLHTEGEPLRVITGGYPEPEGDTMLAKRRYAREHLDHLRKVLMFEPRGHADMYGAILTDPTSADGDVGVLFMHNEGYSTMCGHGIIALGTLVFEIGAMDAITNRPDLRLDTPAGRIIARAEWDADAKRVRQVSFENVPSFVFLLDQVVAVPEVGQVRLDVAFGGAFYAYVDVAANGLDLHLDATDYRALIDIGMRIKRAVMDTIPIQHPTEADLGFLYGTIFYNSASEPAHNSRNVCVFAEGEVDRSPTGTGVSGRLALEFAKGRLNAGDPFVVESILGTTFTGKVLRETTFGPHAAIIPEITGRAWITGRHEFVVTPDDPLREGFILR